MSIDWTILLTGIGCIATIAGLNIALFSWLRTDIKEIKTEAAADRRDILQLIRSIQQEMKDFHGRLERQDAEFKGKLALQDAEFKAHIMHCHGFEERNKGQR